MGRQGQRQAMTRPTSKEVARFRAYLLNWFAVNGRSFSWRRPKATVYQRVLPEVLLQRTRAESVAAFLPTFVRDYPSWRAISRANPNNLAQRLRPLGLWRRRTASLLALARAIAHRRGRFPSKREAIERLPGVGQYIANAIQLFAFGKPEPLLDASMARVLERWLGPRRLADIRYDPDLQYAARLLVRCKRSALVSWALLDLAASVCHKRRPDCVHCPVVALCREGRRRVTATRGFTTRAHPSAQTPRDVETTLETNLFPLGG